MDNFQTPKLAPPGAGLPWLENFVLRYLYYPLKVKQATWGQNLDRLQHETKIIIGICEHLTEREFQTRLLVRRLRGMEDSSRFWSVALTIEHLCITMKGMSYIASEIAQSHSISVVTDTAKVKPKQEDITSKLEMIEKFKKCTNDAMVLLKPHQSQHLDTVKINHPWFGPISAEGWVWVIAQHQALHRKQIQLIVEQL
jgi:hypothetical protein